MDKPVRIIPHEKYLGMYRLQWENGDVSAGTTNPKPWMPGGHYGFYSKTWATHILNNYELCLQNMEKEGPPLDIG